MAGEWKVVPLGQLYDFSSGLSKPRSAFGSGYPFLGFKDVFYNSSVPLQLTELVDSSEQERTRCSIRRGDVFVTRTSETMDELGMSCVALCDIPDATFNGFTKRLRPKDSETVVPEYARYYFRALTFRQAVTAMSSLSTRASLNNDMLERLSVVLPPAEEQAAIGHILGTLDDKIELNRRMSETLEAMARALFKSWFVDFDPVRVKAEGRDPGLPQPLADLFPDSFEDSELGEIPRGWEVKAISDLAEVVGGSTPRTERTEYWVAGTHHWVTPKDLSGLSMPVLLDTERKITDAGLAQISSGLLPKGTVLLSSRAPIGYLAIAEVPVAVNQGFIAMKPRPGTSNLFLLRWASAAHDEIVSHANGSTFLEISKSSFRPIRIVAPSPPVMGAFDRVTRPMYLKVVEHERDSRTLAALRDALLPKLISGELRVDRAESFIGRAV
jgi:type I restriction enzyme S subunit